MPEQSERNVFLIFLLLRLRESNPLGSPTAGAGGSARLEEQDGYYSLLVGLLDASEKSTSTPFAQVQLGRSETRLYNGILDQMNELFDKYYQPEGFIEHPARFSSKEQASLSRKIHRIGTDIHSLILSTPASPIKPWLERALEGGGRALDQQVTIITNEFDIPWYWMRAMMHRPMLCEVCSLGMLQLTSKSIGQIVAGSSDTSIAGAEGRRGHETLRALLIGGSSNTELPFLEEELRSVKEELEGDSGGSKHRLRRDITFKVERADTAEALHDLSKLKLDEVRRLNRIVHYTGHWDFCDVSGSAPATLHVNGDDWEVERLKDFVCKAVLALDGCSSSHGLRAWDDVQGLTSSLLSLGALGCIVTVLPVKNDPIAAGIFWKSYYSTLLSGRTIGQALSTARKALSTQFRDLGSENPTPSMYQLIGNPSVKLFAGDDSGDE